MAAQGTATVPAGFEDLLDRPLIAHFATTRPDGSIQVNPMWFVWENGQVKLTHTKERQKFRNVAQEPRVALSIVDPDDAQRYLEIRGVVDSVVDDPGAAFYAGLRQRYGAPAGPIPDAAVRVIMTIRPTEIYARQRGPGGPVMVRRRAS
jgi:PPOX class probable F420-dependent enzyme